MVTIYQDENTLITVNKTEDGKITGFTLNQRFKNSINDEFGESTYTKVTYSLPIASKGLYKDAEDMCKTGFTVEQLQMILTELTKV